jgi:hypothetical protein
MRKYWGGDGLEFEINLPLESHPAHNGLYFQHASNPEFVGQIVRPFRSEN